MYAAATTAKAAATRAVRSSAASLMSGRKIDFIRSCETDAEITSSFTVVINYYNDFTDGEFSITISQLGSASLFIGNYTIEIGCDGTVLDGPTTYRDIPAIVINLAPRLGFSVYDTPILTTSWSLDNGVFVSDDIIPSWTLITVNGTLTYSNGTGIANEYITITLYDGNGDLLAENTTVLTNSNGEFEWTFLVEEDWDL